MIYVVYGYNSEPVYFDSNEVNSKESAEALLAQRQAKALQAEELSFSICTIFTDGENQTWKKTSDSDPEDMMYQVFDVYTGTYTQVHGKTAAFALNEQKKQNLLAAIKLDKVYELEQMPSE